MTFNARTGVLSGTPAAGTGGTYTLHFTAHNGAGSDATQTFTLAVNQAPAFISGNTAALNVGSNGSFTVQASGFPAPTLSENPSNVLPTGVLFNAATGLLSGTPAAGTAGSYTLHFTAHNGAGSDATQTLTLTVNPAQVNLPYQIIEVGNQVVAVTPSGQGSTVTVLDPNGNLLATIGTASPAKAIALGNNLFGILLSSGAGSSLALYQANGQPVMGPNPPQPPSPPPNPTPPASNCGRSFPPGPNYAPPPPPLPPPPVGVVISTATPAQVIAGQNGFAIVQAASVAIYDQNGNLKATLSTTTAATVMPDQNNFLIIQPGSVTVVGNDGHIKNLIATTGTPSVVLGQNGFALVTAGSVAIFDQDGNAHGSAIPTALQSTVIADQDNFLIAAAGSMTVVGSDGHVKTTIATTGTPSVVIGQNGFALMTAGSVAIYDKDGHAQGSIITTIAPTTVLADQDRFLIITPGSVTVVANSGQVQASIATTSPPTVIVGQNGFAIVAGSTAMIYTKDGNAQGSAIAVTAQTQVVAVADRFAFVQPIANGQVQVAIYGSDGNFKGSSVT